MSLAVSELNGVKLSLGVGERVAGAPDLPQAELWVRKWSPRNGVQMKLWARIWSPRDGV